MTEDIVEILNKAGYKTVEGKDAVLAKIAELAETNEYDMVEALEKKGWEIR